MATGDFSVVLTTWNNAGTARQCLDHLTNLDAGGIYLCDCGSSDGTVEIIRREYPAVRILSRDRALNFAQARNIGLLHAASPYVLFVEGDWLVSPADVAILSERLSSRMDVWSVVPRFQEPDGTIQIGHNVRRFPTVSALSLELLLLHKLVPNNSSTRRYRMTDFDHASDRIVDHACGAVLMVRRAEVLGVGGYDEEFAPAWMEDVDLSLRLSRLGRKTLFCADATARHLGRETTRHFLIEHAYDDFHRGVLRYGRRYLGRSWQLVRVAMAFGMLERAAFSHVLPGKLRSSLLRAFRIYNSDDTIQTYKQMYFRAFSVALRGASYVSRQEPAPALAGLSGWPRPPQRQTPASDD